MKLSRRGFFTGLAAAAVTVAALPKTTVAKVVEIARGPALLPLDGRTLSRAAYPELFATIGEAWTRDDVPKHMFRLPDYRGLAGHPLPWFIAARPTNGMPTGSVFIGAQTDEAIPLLLDDRNPAQRG